MHEGGGYESVRHQRTRCARRRRPHLPSWRFLLVLAASGPGNGSSATAGGDTACVSGSAAAGLFRSSAFRALSRTGSSAKRLLPLSRLAAQVVKAAAAAAAAAGMQRARLWQQVARSP